MCAFRPSGISLKSTKSFGKIYGRPEYCVVELLLEGKIIDVKSQPRKFFEYSGKSERIEKIKKGFLCTKDHAFRTEYNGGFDVVIGNPPYIFAREKISQTEKDYYTKFYNSADYQVNTYLLFIEKSIGLIKENGA